MEIFFAPAKNTTRPLTVWIGGTDIERGLLSVGRCAILGLANYKQAESGRATVMKLYEVTDAIQIWIRTVQEMYRDKIDVEFLVEREDYLRYIIESTNYLAEIIVEPEGFHPYRYVAFEALDKRKDLPQEAYFYLDEKDSSLENILENLNMVIPLTQPNKMRRLQGRGGPRSRLRLGRRWTVPTGDHRPRRAACAG